MITSMSDDFKSGVEWYLGMGRVFTGFEMRILWALMRADGKVIPFDDLEFVATGRLHNSNVVKVHISRMRDRALGFGYKIEVVRKAGYRMVAMTTPLPVARDVPNDFKPKYKMELGEV